MQNDPVPAPSERPAVLVGYGLFLLAVVCGGITALIGAVIAYARRDDARGTVWESHYRNLILVFWVGTVFALSLIAMALSGLFAAIGLALSSAWANGAWADGDWIASLPLLGAVIPLVLLAWIAFGLWYLYRVLRGFIHALDDRAY